MCVPAAHLDIYESVFCFSLFRFACPLTPQVAENQLFAPFVLNEKLDKVFDITASVTIILGAVLTTIFGPQGGGDVCEVRFSVCSSFIVGSSPLLLVWSLGSLGGRCVGGWTRW